MHFRFSGEAFSFGRGGEGAGRGDETPPWKVGMRFYRTPFIILYKCSNSSDAEHISAKFFGSSAACSL
jgi:hypothetical protein